MRSLREIRASRSIAMDVAIACLVACLTACAFAAFSGISSARADEAWRVRELPGVMTTGAWRAEDSAGGKPAFFARDEALFVRVNCAKGTLTDLRLAEPVAMGEDATGFTFRCGNNGVPAGLRVQLIVRDAAGGEYFFYTSTWHSFEKGVFFPEHIQHRGSEDRFVTPGMSRLEIEPSDNATVSGPGAGMKPRRPYAFAGIRFAGEHQGEGAFTEFFLRDFAATRLEPQDSDLYYQFRDQECFGELDPAPFMTPAHLGKWYGRSFQICWDVRADYAATPFLAGGRTFLFEPAYWQETSDRVPYELQQAERIEFPVSETGTYWVRARLRWSHQGRDPVPQLVEEKEFRLDVVRGDKPGARVPVPPERVIENCYVRVAPGRNSLIYRATDEPVVRVQFRRPGTEVPGGAGGTELSARIAVHAGAAGEIVKSHDAALSWQDDGFAYALVDLGDLAPGAYEIHAALLAGTRVFDEVRRLVGRQHALAGRGRGAVPASVASARDLVDGPKARFHLSSILPDNVSQTSAEAWNEHYRPFLDRAGELSRDVELPISWRATEPLPGVYDWRLVDRYVAYAREKALGVLLWPSFRDTPEWIAGHYEQNVDGQIFGSRQPYLFHGGRLNYVNAPAIRERLVEFARQIALRYRSDPAVTGYYFLYEHPGDAPYAGWYEGYAEESVEAFRRQCRKRGASLADLNARWKTRYRSWREVTPPPKDAAPLYWLEWLRFKTEGIEGLLKELVRVTREIDPRRPIVVYADGIHDLAWFRERGCLSANGGSHDVMNIHEYAAYALAGVPQRTEDHSPGNWSAYFPAQLDASVFAMMAGGGASAHCKAFVRTSNHFTETGDPQASLGRYRRFMPIWQELRETEPAEPIRAFMLRDLASYLVDAKTTYTGWRIDPWATITISQAQVPCAAAYGDLWERGRLLVVGTSLGRHGILEEALIDRIASYVERGGVLLMSADAGRRSMENPESADWVLLRRFGFTPPAGEPVEGRRENATPLTGEIFPQTARAFSLRETWDVGPQPETETAACFNGDRKRVAISWKSFGRGRVAVQWAQTFMPPLFSPGDANYAFLADIAAWAGIEPLSSSSDNRLWTYLLKKRAGGTWYGMVHLGWWQGTPSAPVEGSVRWPGLPEGSYRVTELTSGREFGEFTASQLRGDGLKLRLGPREVAIFRMARR